MKKIMLVPLIFVFVCMTAYGENSLDTKGDITRLQEIIASINWAVETDGMPEVLPPHEASGSELFAASFEDIEFENIAIKDWIKAMAEEYYEFFRHPF